LIQLAFTVERDEVVAAAHVDVSDEDLRYRGAAARALDHHLLQLASEVDADLLVLHALGFEQRFRAPAIWTKGLGVDLNDRHLSAPLPRYLGMRFNASTAKDAARAPM